LTLRLEDNLFRVEQFFVRLGWVVVLSCLLAGCGVVRSADSADDAKKWQGTWKMVDTTYDGGPQTGDVAWVVDGGHYRIRMNGVLHEDLHTFTLDAGKKRIDVFHHDTPPGTYGGKLKGIYEINGDSLTVCYELTGQRYPKSFDAPRGSRQVLYHFRRE
jgi:uncharacterized protein (TIGR03067 family)